MKNLFALLFLFVGMMAINVTGIKGETGHPVRHYKNTYE
jgi:hypothetical protein